MKPCYADYVQYAMRYYAKHAHDGKLPNFRSNAEKQNWKIAEETMNLFAQVDQDTLCKVFLSGFNIFDNIHTVSTELGIEDQNVWDLVNQFERTFAFKRGLI